MRKFIIAAAALATLAIGAPAAAASKYLTTSEVRVPYGDLDLGTPAGVKQLRKRIAVALDTACGSLSDPVFETYREAVKCRRVAKPKADAEVARVLVPATVDLAAATIR